MSPPLRLRSCAPRRRRRIPTAGRGLVLEWPASGTVTRGFGYDGAEWHPGIDIGSLRSLDITAAAPGVVEAVGYAPGFEGYGNIVARRHGLTGSRRSTRTVGRRRARSATASSAGQKLGLAGCTGYCTGTHLHFELRDAGAAFDPAPLLPLAGERQPVGVRHVQAHDEALVLDELLEDLRLVLVARQQRLVQLEQGAAGRIAGLRRRADELHVALGDREHPEVRALHVQRGALVRRLRPFARSAVVEMLATFAAASREVRGRSTAAAVRLALIRREHALLVGGDDLEGRAAVPSFPSIGRSLTWRRTRAVSSVGRAPARQAGGHWFEPGTAHLGSPGNGASSLGRCRVRADMGLAGTERSAPRSGG